jgi:murein L,D-transpeptidase YcbB/YkuD
VWARGIDVQRDRVAAFCAEARRAGFTVTLTYPGSANEAQHVNFRKEPKFDIWKIRPLRPGMQGPRGSLVVRLLWALIDPQTGKPYLDRHIRPRGKITPEVVQAINAFQHDHHLPVSGVVGVHTIRALRAARRLQKKHKASAAPHT